MPKYTIELFKDDGAILARGERDAPILNRAEMLQWAREAAERFGMVWSVSDKVSAPPLSYASILCEGRELLRLNIPSELSLQ